MCGIVGAIGKIGINERNMFQRMLQLDTIRGPHSTGVLMVNHREETSVRKSLGTPWDLFEFKSFTDKFTETNNVLIGHNRWATQGKITKQNAHPFDMGKVIGVHNGTLTSRFYLDDYKDFEVDSENLYHHMTKHGAHKTIPELRGAFTLVWYDTEEKTVNFVRNEERPLYFAYTKDHKSLFLASEAWMIAVSASACDITVEQINEVPHGYVYSVPVNFGFPANVKPIEGVSIRKVELYKPPVLVGYTQTYTTQPKRELRAPIETKTTAIADAVKKQEKVHGTPTWLECNKLVGKSVTFYVWGEAENPLSKQKYILGFNAEHEGMQIRCYPEVGDKRWKQLINGKKYFTGIVRHFQSFGDQRYLAIDLRTIVEIDLPELDDEPLEEFEAYKGKMISEEEFYERTSKGCSWCASCIDIQDHDKITWIDHSEFVCNGCKDLKDVQDYLKAV